MFNHCATTRQTHNKQEGSEPSNYKVEINLAINQRNRLETFLTKLQLKASKTTCSHCHSAAGSTESAIFNVKWDLTSSQRWLWHNRLSPTPPLDNLHFTDNRLSLKCAVGVEVGAGAVKTVTMPAGLLDPESGQVFSAGNEVQWKRVKCKSKMQYKILVFARLPGRQAGICNAPPWPHPPLGLPALVFAKLPMSTRR